MEADQQLALTKQASQFQANEQQANAGNQTNT
jgi:hypothetical protein